MARSGAVDFGCAEALPRLVFADVLPSCGWTTSALAPASSPKVAAVEFTTIEEGVSECSMVCVMSRLSATTGQITTGQDRTRCSNVQKGEGGIRARRKSTEPRLPSENGNSLLCQQRLSFRSVSRKATTAVSLESWNCWRESWRTAERETEGEEGEGTSSTLCGATEGAAKVVAIAAGVSASVRLRRTWSRFTSGESGVDGCRLTPCCFFGDGVRMFCVCLFIEVHQ